ncbi:MAG TPA: sulfotransferase [Actinomycetota bacterium]
MEASGEWTTFVWGRWGAVPARKPSCHRVCAANVRVQLEQKVRSSIESLHDHPARDRDPAADEEQPVFLVGPARSGTSLVYKVLCLHPEAAYISNYLARYPRRWSLGALDRIARRMPERTRSVWFSGGDNAYVYGRSRPLHERLFPMPVEGEPVYEACGIGQDGISQYEPKGDVRPNHALHDAFAAIRRSAGGSFLVNKRIANNRRIELLAATFPSARFISLVRDGRAVAYSLSRVDWWETSTVWWYGGTPEQWRAEGRDPWELCARNWVEEMEAMDTGLATLDPSRVLRLSYESFVTDPHDALERMASFGGFAPSDGWSRSVRALSFPNRNESWQQALEPAAIDTITGIQSELLERHGYDR